MADRARGPGGKTRFRETTVSPGDNEVSANHAETPRRPLARAGSLLRALLGPNQPLPARGVPERRSHALSSPLW